MARLQYVHDLRVNKCDICIDLVRTSLLSHCSLTTGARSKFVLSHSRSIAKTTKMPLDLTC